MTGHLLRRFHDHEIVPKSEVLLRSLGINPPSEEEVAAHKKREELKHPPSLMWQLAQMIGEQRLRHLLAISFMLAFAGFYFAYGANPITTVVHHAIGVTSGLFLAFVLWLSEGRFKGQARWRVSTIHLANPDEMRELPHYVQERIILIRARAPEVSFSIEKLVQDGWTLDPIVRAHFRNEKRRVVIAIFDEKGKKVF